MKERKSFAFAGTPSPFFFRGVRPAHQWAKGSSRLVGDLFEFSLWRSDTRACQQTTNWFDNFSFLFVVGFLMNFPQFRRQIRDGLERSDIGDLHPFESVQTVNQQILILLFRYKRNWIILDLSQKGVHFGIHFLYFILDVLGLILYQCAHYFVIVRVETFWDWFQS